MKSGKKIALSACLVAFMAANIAPLANAQSYISGVEENAENYSYSGSDASKTNSELRRVMLKGAVSLEKGNQ